MGIASFPVTDRASWLAHRHKDVTASVAGALLGVHEYTTAFELWAIKSGRLAAETDETPAMRRGRLLEPVAVQMIREDYPDWTVEQPGVYLTDPDIRLGATPDLYVECPKRGPGVVQIKTTADMIYRMKWRDPDTYEVVPPLWIAVQALVEAHLSGRNWAAVALMVVGLGLDLHVIDVPMNRKLITKLREETVRFWELVASGEEPAPDYGRDRWVIDRLFANDDGSELDLSRDNLFRTLLTSRAAYKNTIKEAQDALEPVEAEIRHRMGNASVAHIGGGDVVTLRTVKRRSYTVAESSYRALRVPKNLE